MSERLRLADALRIMAEEREFFRPHYRRDTIARKSSSEPAAVNVVSYRSADLGGWNAEDRTISFSFSSETPVQKSAAWEILSHDPPECLRMNRFEAGVVCVLKNHQWDQVLGRVTRAYIMDRKGFAVAKLSKSTLAEEYLRDLRDGSGAAGISVGYQIHGLEVGDDIDGLPSYVVTDWSVLEVSVGVPVPADYSTIGVGRSE
jgi:hypothetical protein